MTSSLPLALPGLLALGCAGLVVSGPALAQEQPTREITQIAGDLYRFQNNFHYSVFLVTPEGAIVTDPINAEAAQWLEDQIRERFGQEVRYVIYSHDHADHISGGEVFADTATVVAHDLARADIVAEQRPTAVPDVTFSDNLTIELGGKTVELSYVGRNHSDNSIVMRFPDERALFAVDFIPVRSLAFRDLGDSYFPDWLDSLRAVEAMDFDILVPGHGPLGAREDVAAFRGYLEDLQAAVMEHTLAGRSLEEMQAQITLDKYRDWGGYQDMLPLNIAGMYNQIRLHRVPNPQ